MSESLFRRFGNIRPDLLIPDSEKVVEYLGQGIKQIEETPRRAVRYVTTSLNDDERRSYSPTEVRYRLYGKAGALPDERKQMESFNLQEPEHPKTILTRMWQYFCDFAVGFGSPVMEEKQKKKESKLAKWFRFYRR